MASSHSEIKAGAFVAFSFALLLVMVFAVGDCGRLLKGRQDQVVFFSHVTGLQPNSAVNYAGVEVGRVRRIRIVKNADRSILDRLPPINANSVERLPLTIEEVERLKGIKDPTRMDREARELCLGRTVIALDLEIVRSREELMFRQDDLVRLESTLMGDSTVEISAGSGTPVPAGQALLGDSSNLFTQLSSSMRDIRNLLAKVSNMIGEDERVAIQATIANIKDASDKISRASEDVRQIVAESREPISQAITDLGTTMSEARQTATAVRETVTEVKPKVVSALESGQKMMEAGRGAAEAADQLLTDARPKAVALLEEARRSAAAATAALTEAQELLLAGGNALDENRPAVRRALGDVREAGRNLKDMSARLKRQPWLLLKKPRGEQDVVLLDAAVRNLAAAGEDLVDTAERMERLAADPETAARLESADVQQILKEIRAIYQDLENRRGDLEQEVKELDRKGGGKLLRKTRDEADREK